jgi:hypothetical protein
MMILGIEQSSAQSFQLGSFMEPSASTPSGVAACILSSGGIVAGAPQQPAKGCHPFGMLRMARIAIRASVVI